MTKKRTKKDKSGSNDPIHSNHSRGDSVTSGASVEPDKDIVLQNEDENNGEKGEVEADKAIDKTIPAKKVEKRAKDSLLKNIEKKR